MQSFDWKGLMDQSCPDTTRLALEAGTLLVCDLDTLYTLLLIVDPADV